MPHSRLLPLRSRAALLVSFVALSLGAALTLGPTQAAARDRFDETTLEVTADTIEYERETELWVAEGDVRVIQLVSTGRRHLDADWVVFSTETRRGVASGDVRLVDGEDLLTGAFLEFDIDSLQGLSIEGHFDTGPDGFRIWARLLVKTGDDTYEVEDARFTTCRCPDDEARHPWQLDATRADLEVGEYGTARNTTIGVLGVPVFWVPWMVFPLKTERESGFLLPEFGYSNRLGFEVGLPFFWAAADPINVTATPRYLSERGWKPDLLIEYVIGQDSEGQFYGSFIQDRDVRTPELLAELGDDRRPDPFGNRRWAAIWQGNLFLPAELRLHSDITLVSDNEYPSDFNDLREYRRDRFLESTLFLDRHFGRDERFAATGSLAYADDLQNPDDVDRDRLLLQRAPALSFASLDAPVSLLPGLTSTLDVDYTHFWAPDDARDLGGERVVGRREFVDTGIDGLPDGLERSNPTTGGNKDLNLDNAGNTGGEGPERNGLFEEGEPLADRGHRLVLNPRLGAPLRLLDAFEFHPEVGYQEVLYWTDAQDFAERGLFTGRVDLQTRLDRHYGAPGAGFDHRLVPRIGWLSAVRRSQSGSPVFVPESAFPQRRLRQLTRQNVVRDPSDRQRDSHALFVGLGNHFFVPMPLAKGGKRVALELGLSGEIDFEDEDASRLVLEGRSFRSGGFTTRFHLSYDPSDRDIDEGLLDLKLRLPRWRFFSGQVGGRYRFVREIPAFFEDFRRDLDRFENFSDSFDRVNQLTGTLRIGLGKRFAFGYQGSYDIDGRELLTNRGYVEYTSGCRCWAMQFEVDETRNRGLEFALRFTLLGLGDDKGRPPFAGGRGGLGALSF